MNFRASSMHRRFACPGSAKMEHGLPDEDSALSREGTTLHAYCSDTKLDRVLLTSYQQDLLRIADEIDSFVIDRVREQFEIPIDEPFESGHEKELWVHLNGKREISGHADRWLRFPARKLVIVLDWKFGFLLFEPASISYQLRSYSVGAFDEWPDSERIIVAIGQPRQPYEQRVSMANYERQDIEAARSELISIIEESRKPDAPLRAGDQCRYCKAKLLPCPEYERVIESGIALISLNGQMTVAAREAQIEAAVRKLSDTQLDKALLGVQFAGWIADPARDEARRRKAENPDSMPEWTIGKPSELRKIADPRRAIQLLSLRGDLSRDEILDCSSPKIGAIEEKLREKKKLTWKDAKKIVEDTLAPVIVREEKRPTLTRASK